ncbi:MAG: SH3 domain-containing protein [Saprospiraceae bacterium]|nr:SH3 domain-containing protein [Saprospiraceae bacterium]
MAKKASLLPKIEVLILAIFFFSFVVWMVPKCAARKAEYQEAEAIEAAEDSLLIGDTTDEIDSSAAISPPASTSVPTPVQRRRPIPGRPQIEQVTPLYVTLENLNMRTEPRVGAKILDRLSLYDEVIFLNEVTDSTQEINLGKITANEPWIKVRNKKGQEGWVYGAGVHYYKIKLEVE